MKGRGILLVIGDCVPRNPLGHSSDLSMMRIRAHALEELRLSSFECTNLISAAFVSFLLMTFSSLRCGSFHLLVTALWDWAL